jgi:peptidoglycan/xylan/chitin deacetylase (PgdA/CDA1 family)
MRGLKRLVALVISVAFVVSRRALRLVGVGGAAGLPTVLTYHAVTESDVPAFEWQMATLRRLARPVFADQALEKSAVARVSVTFDDAFQNVFDFALPVLERYGIPATVFVPTEHLGREPGWVGSEEGRRRLGPVVSGERLKRIDRRSVKLGSHTSSHSRLATLESDRLHKELAGSRRTLEALTRQPVRMLALPYGSVSRATVHGAREAGYDLVFGNVPIAHRHAGLVGRVDTSPRNWPVEFRLKVKGGYNWMAFAVPAKRHLLGFFRRFRTE